MLDGIKMYKKTILRFFLQLKRPEYLIYAPFETIYHTVYWSEVKSYFARILITYHRFEYVSKHQQKKTCYHYGLEMVR